MKIRKATKKDIPKMIDIIEMNNNWYPIKEAKKELNEMFSKSLIKPTYIVAEENGKILAFNGYSSSWADNSVFNLFWANTHPEYQKKGLQRKLNKYIKDELKEKKNPPVKLILISTRIPSIFKKLGLKKITSKYDRDYILMSKELK